MTADEKIQRARDFIAEKLTEIEDTLFTKTVKLTLVADVPELQPDGYLVVTNDTIDNAKRVLDLAKAKETP